MVDFTEILGKKAAEVEKPKPTPSGTYRAQVMKMPEQRTVTVQGDDKGILRFTCKLLMPHDDVDADDIETMNAPIESWPPVFYDVWVSDPAGQWETTQFLINSLGIEEGEKSIGEMCAEAPGKQFNISLKHRPYVDKKTGQPVIAVDVAGTAAL